MIVVLDASFVLAWLLPDEQSAVVEELFADPGSYFLAPDLLRYEIVNALVVGQRRRRIDASEARTALALFNLAPIGLLRPSASSVLELSESHNLSAYDAAYLAVAASQGARLASLDARLAAAAAVLGVPTVV